MICLVVSLDPQYPRVPPEVLDISEVVIHETHNEPVITLQVILVQMLLLPLDLVP